MHSHGAAYGNGAHDHDSDHDPSAHDHDHDDDSDHSAHDHGDHDHGHGGGLWGVLGGIFHLHGHADERRLLAADPAAANDEGIRTIWLALAAPGLTTVVPLAIV